MTQILRSICAFWLVTVLLTSLAIAQTTSASINGTVSDPNGAAVPGAQILILNTDTNYKQTAASNETGLYSATQLPPGHYSVTVEAGGFRKSVQTGLVLTVGQVATLNIALEIGDVKEEVMVTANAELINVTTAEISSVVNQSTVRELPLNGRDPSSLVLLTTGTVNVLPGGSNTGAAVGGGWSMTTTAMPAETGASSGGGRQGSTYYILDGAPNMDTFMALAAPFPNADATQEFRVVTSNFDAQYGFSPGAVVNIQTKSGANAIHGGLFEFVRNTDLNAANFFSHQVDTLKRNQFGGFVGGPIIKNKLFYFGNYQATRSTTAATANTTYTPTAAMLQGDFSAVPTRLGGPFNQPGMQYNKLDSTTWANLVTSSGAPGNAGYTIATTALPLGQDAATGKLLYTGPASKSNTDEGTGRLDYTINDKQRLFVRSFLQYFSQPGGTIRGNIDAFAVSNAQDAKYYNGSVGHNWIINDSTVNNLSLYYSQMGVNSSAKSLDKNGDSVCWSRYTAVTQQAGHCDLEGIVVTSGFNSTWGYYIMVRRTTYGLTDQITKTFGRHMLTAGVNLQHQFSQENSEFPIAPVEFYYGNVTGSGLADFLLGYMSYYQQGAGEISSLKGWQFGFFGQEQYKMRPNLTITAGLRWDPSLPPSLTGGRGAMFIPGQQSTRFPGAPLGIVFPGDRGIPDSLASNSYGYFQPRVGFSWQPKFAPHTAVRGGYGLFTGPLAYVDYNHMVDVAPFSPTFTLNAGSGPYAGSSYIPTANPWQNVPGGNPFPDQSYFASLNKQIPSNVAFQTPMSLSATFDKNFKNSMTQSWSLSIEQQLSSSIAFHLAYVGSQSYHLSLVVDQNPGCVASYVAGCVNNSGVREYAVSGHSNFSPNLSNVFAIKSAGTSTYHSLQASIDKQLSHGLLVHSNFTWSKVIDIASEGDPSQGTPPGLTNPYDIKANRGISDLNRPFISTTNFLYTSPSLKGHTALVRNVLGSWGISAIYTLQSGRPFGISSGATDNSGALQQHDRADVVPGVSPRVKQGSRSEWLNHYVNPAAFTNNAPGTFGNSARNIFRAPYLNSADSAITKNWMYKEQYNLQFRWEFFNTFNHTSFDVPAGAGATLSDMQLGTTNFGVISSVGPIPPRVMQGGLKLTF